MNMDMDMVNVRYMTDSDAVRAGNWLNLKVRSKSGCAAAEFPLELLPQTGLSCFYEHTLLAVAFLYLEKSSSVAVCGWCIANPGNLPSQSRIAVMELLRAMPQYAKQQGATFLLTSFGNRGINSIARGLGFLPGERAENMFMNLKGN